MGGVLQYSLGIATGGAVASLSKVQSALGAVVRSGLGLPGIGVAVAGGIAGFLSLHKAVEKVFEQIEKGAALDVLRRRTGESVTNLYALEKGFKAVGLPAESLTPVLQNMRKSLGGFNEFGEPTKDLFKAIGLSVESLKAANAPEALRMIVGQLAKMDRSEATNFASKIFGRGAYSDVMLLSRSMEGFEEAMAKAGKSGALFGANSVAFDRLSTTMSQLKGKANSFFAGIAAGVTPGLQAVVDVLGKIDLSGIGQKAGQVFGVVIQAVKDGQVGELLYLGIAAGAERGFRFMSSLLGNQSFWNGIAQTALGAFGLLGTGLVKMFAQAAAFQGALKEKAMQEAIDKGTGGLPGRLLRKAIGSDDNFKPETFSDILKRRAGVLTGGMDAVFGGNVKNAFGFMKDGAFDVGGALREAAAASGGVMGEAFEKKFKEIMARVPVGVAPKADEATLKADGVTKFKGGKGEVNALERIGGFFFSNRGSQVSDYARRTADNTNRTNTLLEKVAGKLDRVGAVAFAHD